MDYSEEYQHLMGQCSRSEKHSDVFLDLHSAMTRVIQFAQKELGNIVHATKVHHASAGSSIDDDLHKTVSAGFTQEQIQKAEYIVNLLLGFMLSEFKTQYRQQLAEIEMEQTEQ